MAVKVGRFVANMGLAVVGVVVVVGCSSSQKVDEQPYAVEFEAMASRSIERASEAGADQTQIDILEQARDLGIMSYELAREAAGNYADCVIGLGGHVTFESPEWVPGSSFPDVEYHWGGLDLELERGCADRLYREVDILYALQPAVEAEKFERVKPHLEALEQCTRDNGWELPEDPSYDELRWALIYLDAGYNPDTPDLVLPSVDCGAPVGISIIDDIS